MKNRFFLFCFLAALAVSCVKDQQEVIQTITDDPVFLATIEDAGTRVYADNQLRVLWNADDRVSIFNKSTYNRQYRFDGQDGDNSGAFKVVPNDDFVTSNPLDYVYSVYPYNENTKISNDGEITVYLPAEQSYRQDSFGLGANTMVAVTQGDELMFKNLCGYFAIKLYGDNVSVSSITLKGNNNEPLAGKATVVAQTDAAPTLQMDSAEATKELTLTCATPVTLGSTAETATTFWFVIPPTTFTNGFALTVTGRSNGSFEKTTSGSLEIKRNILKKSAALKVEIEDHQPTNTIYYTSSDGSIIAPYSTSAFGSSIISNEYVNGKGVITFDGDVTTIGNRAFYRCTNLTSILIPKSVTNIGDYAFNNCTRLTSLFLPERVRSIGDHALQNCSSLLSITIPKEVVSIGDRALDLIHLESITVDTNNPVFDSRGNCNAIIISSNNTLRFGCKNTVIPESVTSIGGYAFYNCLGLSSITIPEGVKIIEGQAFVRCSNLSFISIPNSVTIIGNEAFAECSSLTNINIPESVTSIGEYAFSECSSLEAITIPNKIKELGYATFIGCEQLTSVLIPEGLTGIGDYAFAFCERLANINLPDGVTNIGEGAFTHCNALISFTIPKGVYSIKTSVLSYCNNLVSVIVPNTVTSIGESSFEHCSNLSSFTIPESVSFVGSLAFKSCCGLTSITIKGTTPPRGSISFLDDTNNCPIYVPASSVDAYKSAQYWSDYADRIQAIGTPVAVDLGLSVKWASFNLGANKPEEFGDYYAWGETEPYYEAGYAQSENPIWKSGKETGYTWKSYIWCNGSNTSLTKYNNKSNCGIVDNNMDLDLEDDAARHNLGGNWRMPSMEEITELIDNCTTEWTTINEITGCKFTSKIAGYTDKSIFLPASGYRYGFVSYNSNFAGEYRSSTINQDYPYLACGLGISKSNHAIRNDMDRELGGSIRPVCPKE